MPPLTRYTNLSERSTKYSEDWLTLGPYARVAATAVLSAITALQARGSHQTQWFGG